MTSILTLLLAGGVIALGAAAVWQHLRYLHVRRERIEDRQPLLYSGAAFHTVTFLKVKAALGREGELATLRALRSAIEAPGGGRVIYAGLVGVTMAESTQLSNDWSAVLLAQYPSRGIGKLRSLFASWPIKKNYVKPRMRWGKALIGAMAYATRALVTELEDR